MSARPLLAHFLGAEGASLHGASEALVVAVAAVSAGDRDPLHLHLGAMAMQGRAPRGLGFRCARAARLLETRVDG